MPQKKTVDSVKIKAIWDFPEPLAAPRIFTRHFTNLHFCLDTNELSLLCFLIFMSDQLNRIEYSVKVLLQYRQAVKLAQERYQKKKLKTSLPVTRRLFTELIEKGLLIPIDNKFIINPNLTYSKQVSLSEWRKRKDHLEEWCKLNVK